MVFSTNGQVEVVGGPILTAHEGSGVNWYDTKSGILESIKTLDGFRRLVVERHNAGYKRSENLDSFYVMGTYGLDQHGNCTKIKGKIPDDFFKDTPKVMFDFEFWQYVFDNDYSRYVKAFTYNDGNLPPENIACAHCGESWTIENCRDVVVHESREIIMLNEHIGMKLGEFKELYGQRNDAVFEMASGLCVRNDRYVDLRPKYPNSDREWESGISKNSQGWLNKDDGLSVNYVIKQGDETSFNVKRYFHSDCNDLALQQEKRLEFEKIFSAAGFNVINFTAVPNEYCGCEHCAPWFKVTTEFGVIKISWRKRVVNIDWSEISSLTDDVLFDNESVTRGPSFIHAWGYDKAEEYLSCIFNYLSK